MAAADDQILDQPHDMQTSVIVEPPEIAAHKPARGNELALGGTLII
jgi:hypothetical protein